MSTYIMLFDQGLLDKATPFMIFSIMVFGFYSFFRMMWISYFIDHLRKGGTLESISKGQIVWKVISTRINNHMLPGPYFSEFHDTDEIKALIKKRNRVVIIFWIVMIVVIVSMVIYKKTMPQ